MKLQEIIAAVQEYHPDPDLDLIRRAFAFVRRHHEGQTRASGEPYITHVTEVAFLATKLKLDVSSIVAAFLHDTVEDTDVTIEEIGREFGSDVAELVDGVTKLSRVNFSSRVEAQAENFRKMLLAMAKDIRVLLVKLCDRIHNMRTLEFLSESRRVRIAQETIDIYAPLAHRLGIYWMKSELEDLSFRYLKPEIYNNVKQQVNKKKKERQRYIEDTTKLLQREFEQNGITANVLGRPKHFYSIYEKMERDGLSFDEIYDLIAFRITVPTQRDCYAALGVVHAAWKPIPGRFKDYIAMPKPNKYQSLHTTVIGPQGARIEIQIRTPDMHEVAERGIAAHWIYKEGGLQAKHLPQDGLQFAWLRDLLESEKLLRDPLEFIALVKEDLFPKEVYVFSPKGDLIALGAGSTPIDFAYHIHSEIGDHCCAARVNGQQVPLSYRLKNGDTVEIVRSNSQSPSKDWLTIVATSKAKQRIRSWLRTEESSRSITVGKELLTKDLRKVKLNLNVITKDGSLMRISQEMGFRDLELLFAEIGYGKVSTTQIVRKLLPNEADIDRKLAEEESTLQKIFHKAAKAFGDRGGIKVNGIEDVVFRFANCCEPLPGDELVGYVTRGRGVAIHKQGCTQTHSFDPRRLLPVTWDDSIKTLRRVRLKVICTDRVGLLAAMSQSISGTGANILAAQLNATPGGKSVTSFDVHVESAVQLNLILRALQNVEGVLKIERDKKARV